MVRPPNFSSSCETSFGIKSAPATRGVPFVSRERRLAGVATGLKRTRPIGQIVTLRFWRQPRYFATAVAVKLRLRQLSKNFNGQVVLDSVCLSLEKVHTLVLIGPSGGGKTTLLRIIAGLEYPSSGELEIDGQPVLFTEDSLLRYRRTIGTVFQAFNLFPHLTALRNITLPLEKVHQYKPAEARQVAESVLERFGLLAHGHK